MPEFKTLTGSVRKIYASDFAFFNLPGLDFLLTACCIFFDRDYALFRNNNIISDIKQACFV